MKTIDAVIVKQIEKTCESNQITPVIAVPGFYELVQCPINRITHKRQFDLYYLPQVVEMEHAINSSMALPLLHGPLDDELLGFSMINLDLQRTTIYEAELDDKTMVVYHPLSQLVRKLLKGNIPEALSILHSYHSFEKVGDDFHSIALDLTHKIPAKYYYDNSVSEIMLFIQEYFNVKILQQHSLLKASYYFAFIQALIEANNKIAAIDCAYNSIVSQSKENALNKIDQVVLKQLPSFKDNYITLSHLKQLELDSGIHSDFLEVIAFVKTITQTTEFQYVKNNYSGFLEKYIRFMREHVKIYKLKIT